MRSPPLARGTAVVVVLLLPLLLSFSCTFPDYQFGEFDASSAGTSGSGAKDSGVVTGSTGATTAGGGAGGVAAQGGTGGMDGGGAVAGQGGTVAGGGVDAGASGGTGGSGPTPCQSDADCASSTVGLACDTSSGACVECLPSADYCALGLYCTTQNTCAIGCATDLDCVGVVSGSVDAGAVGDSGASSGPDSGLDASVGTGASDGGGFAGGAASDAAASGARCDVATHQCVGCVTDDDCPSGSVCEIATSTCQSGCSAARPCPTGFDCCDGQCTNLLTDLAHCGDCAAPCDYPGAVETCAAGICAFAGCEPGFGDCNASELDGCEADLSSDPDNCNGCGLVCSARANAAPACSGFQCTKGVCDAGFADCDGDPTNGCEVNTDADEGNCGGCSVVCDLLNANPACQSGSCAVASCTAGYEDCDTLPSNGCEVDTRTNASNCGACGNVCNIAGGSSVCVNSTCQLTTCAAARADCNNDGSDGCEVSTGTDPYNCGGCGNACSLPNATASCDQGGCVVAQCAAGFADCDGNPTNGCEAELDTDAQNCGACGTACSTNHSTPSCALGACVVGCDASYADCDLNAGNGCEVNTQTSVANCGTCGNTCSATGGTPVCLTGTCGVSNCIAPLGDCDGNASNGCETDTSTDLSNCGGCGVSCFVSNGTPACTAGNCNIASCNSGYADCNGLIQDGCEALLNTPVNCGQCGQYCLLPNANASCSTGQCLIQSCQTPFADCDGNPANGCEVNLDTSAGNCGACGTSCNSTNGSAYCSAGLCQITCAAGFGNCDATASNGCETTLTSNPLACGACGNVCSALNGTPSCVGNTCAIGSCNPGYADCDLQLSNGCETSTDSNSLNCGSCGRACSSVNGSSTCSGGACNITCDGGWDNCDGNALNGCEVSTGSSLSNCGACGALCDYANAAESCSSGACLMGACTPGFADCDLQPSNGCETSLSTLANCGACSNACTNAHGSTACQSGSCAPTCAAGYADCNGNPNDGCETSLRTVTDCGACGALCSRANGTETCDTGTCQLGVCDLGYGDCDGVDANGCETPTDTDVSNCGACGNVCSGNNGTRSCVSGACQVACDTGYGNCDGSVTNGCEVSLSSDVSNCGTCANACSFTNGAASCFSGACQLSSCTAGYGNCDGDATNGCEATLTTLANCGACGAVCSRANAAESCASGTCTLGACDAGYADCDGNAQNGCEVDIASSVSNCGACGGVCSSVNGTAGCTSGSCTISCVAGYDDCNGQVSDGCEAPLNTVAHCGACATTCTNANGTTSCVSGACAPTCNSGYATCDSNPVNGCETNTQTDAAHCGACGTSCTNANGTTSCVSGACAPACAAGYADCDGDLTNGCETSINTASNCGACGAACTNANGTTSCSAGVCTPSCSAGYADCDGDVTNGCETNTNVSVSNCGSCGNVCPVAGGTPSCTAGVCGVSSCSSGFGDCDGSSANGCETALVSLTDCGACGQTCDRPNATESCSTGTCLLGACNSGFANCDGIGTNGCEVNTDTSVGNCGACGTACSSTNGTASCSLGACQVACDSGFGNCDSNVGNGCETNLTTSVSNCGACGTVCTNANGTTSCSAGVCTPSCAVGYANCDGAGENGCETNLNTTTASCGACGQACTNAHGTTSCSGGSCLPVCDPGYADCDGNARNGCETDLNSDASHCGACSTVCTNTNGGTSCVSGLCAPTCNAGYGDCDSVPTNGCETSTSTSALNCGGCGQACSTVNGTASCSGGACSISCNSGYASCDLSVATGCETSLGTVTNCGACGTACTNANGTTTCSGGLCSPTCASGYANCDGNPNNGCERNINTLTDCGGCNLSCGYANAAESCNAGVCTLGVCDANYGNCDGVTANGCETDLLTSTGNCGSCGAACTNANGTTTCSGGLCSPTCAAGFQSCDGIASNGCETSTATNVDNCGSCGNVCSFANATASCVGSTCTMGACSAGYGDCDVSAANGCEAPLNTVQNCGACGVSCSNANGTTSCTGGACVPSCASGFADCDGDPNNGCETSLKTNTDCGACGQACTRTNATASCSTGTCTLGSCSAGYGNCDANNSNGCETNISTNTSNCGACGTVCSTVNGSPTCSGGACGITCNSGYANCDGAASNGCETNTTNNASNCGACGSACTFANASATCFASACQLGTCNANYADCDSTAANGCETSLLTLSNCGSCGSTCDLANASETCGSGACQLTSCAAGYADCDSSSANGCEIYTQTSTSNCGACGYACSTVNGTASCSAGVCGIGCNAGYGNCDSDVSTGCETPLSTVSNCGTCGTACTNVNGTTTCTSGVCVPACSAGYGNCDGDPTNGCETSTNTTTTDCGSCGRACANANGTTSCSGGVCQPVCNSGWGTCDGDNQNGCETPLNTTSNCTACGVTCTNTNGTTSCDGTQCVPACNLGWGDCDGNHKNGCETNTTNNVNNCGGCGTVCPSTSGTPACVNSVCGYSTCTVPLAECDGNLGTPCETDLSTTVSDCGACGNQCTLANATPTCTSSTCQVASCDLGYADCDSTASTGCEVTLDTDLSNCGSCGNACSTVNAVPTCTLGSCSLTCNSGYGDCSGGVADGCETDTQTSVTNCGSCGNACTNANGTTVCSNGACVPTCTGTYADCDGNPDNGCESDLSSDTANCGACGTACTNANGTTSCSAGVCAPSCGAGYGDCDGNLTNGCETNTNNSKNNCGACGVACTNAHGGTTCTAGVCSPSCSGTYGDCDGDSTNGCETNTSSTVSDCGTCGNVCSAANATSTCSSSACGYSCNSGWGDCNALSSDGCETSLNTVSDCGTCGSTCTNANGSTSCPAGSCVPTCAAGYADCNGIASDGCERNINTLTDCGGCNVVCNLANATEICNAGTCTLSACNTGYGDCDGIATNGCETNTDTTTTQCGSCSIACTNAHGTTSCVAGLCAPGCTAPWDDCDGVLTNGCETNTNTSTGNCGTCGNVCSYPNATASCSTGACQMGTCNAGYGDCTASAGCETNLTNDAAHCGSCGVACTNAHGTTTCNVGVCEPTCASGWADCNGDPSDGCETNTHTLTDCGSCGVACSRANATADCSTGTCQIGSCSAGYDDCDNTDSNGCEVSLNTSKTNCGGCGNACSTTNGTASCSGGTCGITCSVGYGNCDGNVVNGCEANLTNDVNNCSACSNVCTFANAGASCFSSTCQLGTCNSGYANCNGTASDGCEVDLRTLANCGACSTVCDLANASESCASGTCTLSTCSAGFQNCDGNPSNGCEINTTNNVSNCGACGTVCSSTNGTPSCASSTCSITCSSGFGNCNGLASDGCEVSLNTVSNCGTCGTTCTNLNGSTSCTSGACTPTCNAGYGNCDGNLNNGCEQDILNGSIANCGGCGLACTNANGTTSCAAGACVPSCALGYDDCDGNTRNGCETSLSTSSNCGACGVTCTNANGSASCSTGTCQISCAAGYANCDGNPNNGCETNTNSDLNNCGSCDNICPSGGGEPNCVGGVCGVTSCNPGLGNCDGDPTNGCETDLNTNLANCGSCGSVCNLANASETCSGGACIIVSCSSGYQDCDGLDSTGCEINADTSVTNCGTCGNACDSTNGTRSCSLGACSITCNANYGNCDGLVSNGCETDTLTTATDCGSCGTACTNANGSTSCVTGACAPVCNANTDSCDGDLVNGCEANLLTDANNCGGCGQQCTNAHGGVACTSGVCTPTCAAGYLDCDGNPQNGCETNIDSNINDCGACGNVCSNANGTTSCVAGACTPVCADPYGDCNGDPDDGCETNTDSSVTSCGACNTACSGAHASGTCSLGACSLGCDSGWDNCNGLNGDGCEVDLNTTSNCGSCGNTCTNANGGTTCTTGACAPSCNTNYADCNGNPDDGCETSTATLSDCGSCGALCDLANATESCSTGSCSLTSCSAGYGDCDSNASTGCETSTTTLTNCGSCGNACSNAHGSTSCNGTNCVPVCTGTYGDCDTSRSNGCETDTSTNVNNCGGCGNACSSVNGTPTCSGSTCSIGCNVNYGNCDSNVGTGCESNLLTDTAHCGSCAIACTNANGSTSCSGGNCQPVCNSGYLSCDGDVTNGCEVNGNTDVSNCGGCGTVCQTLNASSTSCSGQACQPVCNSGYADCDGIPENGCETNTDTDTSNCGACGTVCSVGSCTLGACDFAFPYVPSNFDPASGSLNPGATNAQTNFDCGNTVQYNSSTDAWTSTCPGFVAPVAQTVDTDPTAGVANAVVLPFQDIYVASGTTLKFIGDKPVILAVYGNATIDGTVTASAVGTTPGAGGNAASCPGAGTAGADDTSSNEGAAGGGGGGYATSGANGGTGKTTTVGIGGGAFGSGTLSPLRGGCPGGAGGKGNTAGGAGGAGGGAVQISAAGTLTISGVVAAAGGGGQKGSAEEDGGGGGGSGGAVLLESDYISIASGAWLTANGGGGAGGQDYNSAGATSGANGGTTTTSRAAGGSGDNLGGNGGGGAASAGGAVAGGNRGTSLGCGLLGLGTCYGAGGGGGGGEGYVTINGSSSCILQGAFSGARTLACAACPICPPESNCTQVIDSGRQYWFCPSGRSWTTARSNCQALGFELAAISSSAENGVVTPYVAAQGDSWFGFNDITTEGTWVWDDGTAVTYTNFASGEPNNSGDCGQFYTSGTWDDTDCTVAKPYICEGSTHCANGVQDGDETGVDCGGSCIACGSNGLPCTGTGDCNSGFCVDGVCCSSACGGSDPFDCQACSTVAGAATDGTCSLFSAATVCRASAGSCDVAETCTGSSGTCPTDAYKAAGTLCRAQAGICDTAETCSGSSATCPANGYAPVNTDCGYSPVFTVYASGAPSQNTVDFSSGFSSQSVSGGVAGTNGWADALKFTSTTGGSSGNLYDYFRISNGSWTVSSGQYIEYDVSIANNVSALGGIDIVDNIGYWRDEPGWADQNALQGHPAGDLSAYAYNTWYHRRLQVLSNHVGATITGWDIVAENDTVSTTFNAYYDNFVVTNKKGGCNGAGVCKIKSGEACTSGLDCSTGTCSSSLCGP